MRPPLVHALAVALLLSAYAVGGAMLVAGAGPGDPVTVEGRVTGPDGSAAGEAVVLVGEYGLLTKLSPDELRDIAAQDPGDVTVVDVAADGAFETTVSYERADAAVALTDDKVSEVLRLGHDNATVAFALHERRPQTVHAAAASVSHGEKRTELHLGLVNNGDAAVENLTVTLGGLPDGWTVADVATDGSYDGDRRSVSWAAVPAGAEADATVRLAVPADAAVGDYEVSVAVDSTSHPVAVDDASVEVLPAETPGPTTTVLGGDETTTGGTGSDPPSGTTSPPEPTASPTPSNTPAPVGTTSPGFGVGLAVAALAGAALGVGRSGRGPP